MNAAYIAIGCAFIAIGGTTMAGGRKAGDDVKARNAKLAGTLLILAGAIFAVTGILTGSSG